MRKRILSLALAITMVLTLLPATAYAAPGDDMSLDAEDSFGITGGGTNWVYFGEYGGEPVKWRVLSTFGNGGTYSDGAHPVQNPLFLLSEFLLADRQFDDDYNSAWQNSEIQTWCKNFAASTSNFSSAELAAIAETTKTDGTYTSTSDPTITFTSSGSILNGDKVFILSAEEAETAAYGFQDDTSRIAWIGSAAGSADEWWLRSLNGANSYHDGIVRVSGNMDQDFLNHFARTRPAFNLNPGAVLFSSAAEDGKVSGPTGYSALTAVSGTAPAEWKLTLLDNSRSFSVHAAGLEFALSPGDTIDTDYYNATSGVNEYISAIITDAADNILYYGRLKAVAGGEEDGQVGVNIPAGIANGDYTLRIFSEQCNGNKETDYAGAFQDSGLTVDTTAPVISGLTPGGAGASVSGSIVITFDDRIGTIGTVSIDGGATFLTGGNLSGNGKVYTIPYSELSYSTEYTVTISGFANVNLIPMISDSSHSFTTRSNSTGGGRTYYNIEAKAGAGGSISPSGSVSAAKGNDKTFTVTADKGYEIEDVLVDGNSVGAVSTYTFEDVNKAHTIKASFKKTNAESTNPDAVNPFADIDQDDWFHESVIYVYKNGLMTGTGNDSFRPAGGMTRGMIVTVLYRLNGGTGSYANNFSDIPSGSWYENATAWAADNGIVNGVGDKRFAPEKTLTREQLVVMLYNYAKYRGLNTARTDDAALNGFSDTNSISSWAEDAMKWAVSFGIITGNGSQLNPQVSASRAEVAAMLQRFIESVL